MSSRIAVLWLLVALLVPSALIASLQNDLTNQQEPQSLILSGYAEGEVSPDMLGTASPTIVRARCLMRAVLLTCEAVGGPHLVGYNRAVQFVAVWVALAALFAGAAQLLPPFAAGTATMLAAGFVAWGFGAVGYQAAWPYDLPAFAFAALGTWAMVAGRFVPFALILGAGTLNKETIVLLLPAYLLAAWPRLDRGAWWRQTIILGAIFAAAYEVPRLLDSERHLPTATFSAYDVDGPRWIQNIRHLTLQVQGFALENIYWAATLHVVPLLGWRMLPRPLRAIYLCAPVLLIPIFFVGNIYELRLYNELIPVGAIATTFVVWHRLHPSAVDATAR